MLYTDGLTESRKDFTEGEDRLRHIVSGVRALPTADIPATIAERMHDIVLHTDDTVLLAIRLRHDTDDDTAQHARPTSPRHQRT
ncbi:hypothetical protein GCM10009754_41490 [Amycolatopsis minnesotensis]|uniref:PPM-type phosphatase domain-containing protein n=1 Tax=Amycolatopsis minnesotensis TaxID=337894 RepID=A0ABN2R898_9PSEU